MNIIDFHGQKAVRITSGQSGAIIGLKGARLYQFEVKGRPVVHFDESRMNRSTHPCGPIFGSLSFDVNARPLVKDGKYVIGGTTYELPQHGFLRNVEWEPDVVTENAATLEYCREADEHEHTVAYPFTFNFSQDICLKSLGPDSARLRYHLLFENYSVRQAPVDLGCHAYFPWMKGLTITGLGGLQYNDETDWDNHAGRTSPFTPIKIDEDVDWAFPRPDSGKVTLHYPDGFATDIVASREVHSFVVWRKRSEGDFICVEPVARGRNSVNLGTAHLTDQGCGFAIGFDIISHKK